MVGCSTLGYDDGRMGIIKDCVVSLSQFSLRMCLFDELFAEGWLPCSFINFRSKRRVDSALSGFNEYLMPL